MKPKAKTAGLSAVKYEDLASYADILQFLVDHGNSAHRKTWELPFLQDGHGIKNLLSTLSAAAPAVPGASDEEWNPLSQRPHFALPTMIGHELGGEINALKEAVDAFTTLSHEMMHVALWEPFFAGTWRPRSKKQFCDFSLMAEGFCFFFSDIVVSGGIRVRLPDGEFALDRQSPSNARFHPVRAFKALAMTDLNAILAVYLEGFSGRQTALWQPRGASHFVASMAAQVYEFYSLSLPYLSELHAAVTRFGGTTEFFKRFCAIPGLPTFLDEADASLVDGEDLKPYFEGFFKHGLRSLEKISASQVLAVRQRRMIQMRAYYALQVRWFLEENLVVAKKWTNGCREKTLVQVNLYLDRLQRLLGRLLKEECELIQEQLRIHDAEYEDLVRKVFTQHQAWVGHRALIAPRRAGGSISATAPIPAKDKDAKIALLQTTAFLIDELTQQMRISRSIAERAKIMESIRVISSLGALGGASASKVRSAFKELCRVLSQPEILELWSVNLDAFDPAHNQFRELAFSYQ